MAVWNLNCVSLCWYLIADGIIDGIVISETGPVDVVTGRRPPAGGRPADAHRPAVARRSLMDPGVAASIDAIEAR